MGKQEARRSKAGKQEGSKAGKQEARRVSRKHPETIYLTILIYYRILMKISHLPCQFII